MADHVLTSEDLALRGTLTQMIAERGHGPDTEQLAQRLGVSLAAATASLRRLHDAHALLLHPHACALGGASVRAVAGIVLGAALRRRRIGAAIIGAKGLLGELSLLRLRRQRRARLRRRDHYPLWRRGRNRALSD